MADYQPLHQQRPPAGLPHKRPTSRSRKIRNWIILLFILLLVTALWSNRSEQLERLIPFIKKDAPQITELHPIVQLKKEELITEVEKLGISILITDDFRSHEEQNALYDKGRESEGPIVTHVRGGESYHNYGLAIDFALKTKKGKVIWDLEYDGNKNGSADWIEVVKVAKQLGFSWGGDWKNFKDYPHLQMDFGYSIRELQRGHRPEESIENEE
ncbi:M15 family metallopeptidase [Paenibacillus sp. GSMTC-2017]|uniref:M15 family metallopeptidase n=1 Tax=Paenibacillus sp. GSMTC-2017 TaxID=2794350 RepID=UPI0018D7C7ED|nr:M15 family metallopeptidase [Paenibacillus sp. GSMTC-2017]MBH5319063.1 M15 family metallopeptidase [Paenibacillus sp. GSMTC-2017]